jgi:hypothetical protein
MHMSSPSLLLTHHFIQVQALHIPAYYTVLQHLHCIVLILYCPVYPLSILGLFAVGAVEREIAKSTCGMEILHSTFGVIKRRTHFDE